MNRSFKVLPHEAIFGGFLLITWIRLGLGPGFGDRDALLYLALILVDLALIGWCRHRPDRTRWTLRLLFHPMALNVVFLNMKEAIPKIAPDGMDRVLQRVDALLVGGNLSLRLERFTTPSASEWFSFCYILFFPYLLFSLIWYFRRELDMLRPFLVGLFTIYGLGFLGYSLVPAKGPWMAMTDQFRVPLAGGFITRLNDQVVRAGSNGVDVFPSLHCAVSSFLLGWDWRKTRWRFWAYLVPCVGLWFSTLYLRYHYLVDLLCGFILSAFAIWLARNFEQRGE